MLNNSWLSNDVSITHGFVLFIVHDAQVCESSMRLCQLILHEEGEQHDTDCSGEAPSSVMPFD